jgi:hypothetical protein
MTEDHYVPFDFGTWRSPAGMDCPRHGLQDGGLVIQVSPRRNGGEVITRRYCGVCVLTALDAASTNQIVNLPYSRNQGAARSDRAHHG